MCDGDRVLNCWDDKVAICRVNGEVDIFQIQIGENNLPTLSEDIWRVTYGNNTIEIVERNTKKKVKNTKTKGSKNTTSNKASLPDDNNEDDDFGISIRPKKG
jgi:hypothetical protein